MKAFTPTLSRSMGVFIPLIVVNCIVMGRAEAFASKNGVLASLMDGIGMGVGYTVGITAIGVIREILGAGTVFGTVVLPPPYQPILIMILPPGAFLVIGFLQALQNRLFRRG
jgi:electron transport complex protein RnfE